MRGIVSPVERSEGTRAVNVSGVWISEPRDGGTTTSESSLPRRSDPAIGASRSPLGDFWGVIEFDAQDRVLTALRLHSWVKYFYDLTRLNGGHNLNDLGNHCEVRFESVIRCPDDDDGD